jgi:TRAP-type C4-dicarboxylate transport system permease large subunit
MNWTHLHLALNHLPVLGVPFVVVLLVWGWVFRKREVVRVAVLWMVLVSVMAIAVKFTGDFAVDVDPKRFSEVRAYVDRHEESADQATTAVFLLGLAAAVALYLGRGERVLPTWAMAVLVALGIGTSGMYARSANLGGQINHPELRSPGPAK